MTNLQTHLMYFNLEVTGTYPRIDDGSTEGFFWLK